MGYSLQIAILFEQYHCNSTSIDISYMPKYFNNRNTQGIFVYCKFTSPSEFLIQAPMFDNQKTLSPAKCVNLRLFYYGSNENKW